MNVHDILAFGVLRPCVRACFFLFSNGVWQLSSGAFGPRESSGVKAAMGEHYLEEFKKPGALFNLLSARQVSFGSRHRNPGPL